MACTTQVAVCSTASRSSRGKTSRNSQNPIRLRKPANTWPARRLKGSSRKAGDANPGRFSDRLGPGDWEDCLRVGAPRFEDRAFVATVDTRFERFRTFSDVFRRFQTMGGESCCCTPIVQIVGGFEQTDGSVGNTWLGDTMEVRATARPSAPANRPNNRGLPPLMSLLV